MDSSSFAPDVRIRHKIHRLEKELPSQESSTELSNLEQQFALGNATSVQVNDTNATSTDATLSENEEYMKTLYLYCSPIFIVCCLISIVMNIRILLSIYWIRRPLSPTLYISLSLAGADLYTSIFFGLGMVLYSLLPYGFNIKVENIKSCIWLSLEALRLSGVIITVGHLLALAINHYLGIRRPLHYLSIMTHRTTSICIILLWTVPIVFFFTYFASLENDGFQHPTCSTYEFMKHLKWRIVFSSLFFAPFLLMFVIYIHIFVIVRRHQASRLRFIRQGSVNVSTQQQQNQQRQFARSVKAVYTTLMILGTYTLGWVPAVLVYLLLCNDCPYPFSGNAVFTFTLYLVVNVLIIVKSISNPIIYAARMNETKMAMQQMKVHFCRRYCPYLRSDSDSDMFGLSSETSQNRLSQYTCNSNILRSNTLVYRMQSIPTAQQNGRTKSVNQELLHRTSTRTQRRVENVSTDL